MSVYRNIQARLEDAREGYPNPLPTLELIRENGYVPQSLNTGIPFVRENTEVRSAQNGSYDNTMYWGAATVQLIVGIAHELVPGMTDTKLEDALRAWLVPSVRARLVYRRSDDDDWRQIDIRGNTGSGMNINLIRSDFDKLSMIWKAPRGISESYGIDGAPESRLLTPATDVEAGRAYDLAHDRTYPASSLIGSNIAPNLGTAPVFPKLFIYGPCTQPRVENITTGETLEFLSSYSLASGDYLEIDFEEGTVLLNGDAGNSRYNQIDFSVSDWWQLIPGTNYVRFYPLTVADPGIARIEWRHGFY